MIWNNIVHAFSNLRMKDITVVLELYLLQYIFAEKHKQDYFIASIQKSQIQAFQWPYQPEIKNATFFSHF